MMHGGNLKLLDVYLFVPSKFLKDFWQKPEILDSLIF
jgi:hypothetical protein